MPSVIRGGDDFDSATPIKFFKSSNQTITSGGLLTIPHGLGSNPSILTYSYKCITIDNGWQVNDEITTASDTNNADCGFIMYSDITNVYVRFDSVNPMTRILFHKTTGAKFTPTVSSWNLIVKAIK